MLQKKLVEKSKEAFVMAIEIYNKPTIVYRVEGFSFFICNLISRNNYTQVEAKRGLNH